MSFFTFTVTLNQLAELISHYTHPVTLGGDTWDKDRLTQLKTIIDGCADDDTVMSINHSDAYEYESSEGLLIYPTGWYVCYGEYEEEGFLDYIADDGSLDTIPHPHLIMGG